MPLTKIMTRGQMTLPRKVRDAIDCRPGDTVLVEATGPGLAQLRVLPRLTLEDLLERYKIEGPVDLVRDREQWENEAADALAP